jgi:hypothetical protein
MDKDSSWDDLTLSPVINNRNITNEKNTSSLQNKSPDDFLLNNNDKFINDSDLSKSQNNSPDEIILNINDEFMDNCKLDESKNNSRLNGCEYNISKLFNNDIFERYKLIAKSDIHEQKSIPDYLNNQIYDDSYFNQHVSKK